jgi:diguanylate cyclase (GGDEF)-like protein
MRGMLMKSAISREIDYLYNNIDTFNEEYFNQVKTLYNELKDKPFQLELCKLSYLLGLIYLDSGRYIDSITMLNETIDLSERLDEFDIKTNALGSLATVYERQHLSLYAVYFRLEVERRLNGIVRSQKQDMTLLRQYNNIGMSYLDLKMYDKAEEYLLLSLRAKENPLIDDETYTQILCNLVIYYSRVSRFDDAMKFLKEIKAIINTYKEHDYLSYLYDTAYAEYLCYFGSVVEAHKVFQNCLTYSIQRFGTIEDVEMIDTWTKMLRDYKMHFELEHITDLLKKFSSELEFDFELSVLENEYLVAKQKQQLQRALKKLEKYTELKDYKANLQQELIFENLDRIVDLQRSYKNEKKSIDKDDLTSCYNRKFLKKLFASFEKQDVHISYIILDVDCFKEYNDNYGHVKGDAVLKTIASILIKNAEDNDSFAVRYGGDEFLIFAPNMKLDEAEELATKIYQEVSKENVVHGHSYISDKLTVTMGISEFHMMKDLQLGQCIASADVQLYKGKEAGRNCIYSKDKRVQV